MYGAAAETRRAATNLLEAGLGLEANTFLSLSGTASTSPIDNDAAPAALLLLLPRALAAVNAAAKKRTRLASGVLAYRRQNISRESVRCKRTHFTHMEATASISGQQQGKSLPTETPQTSLKRKLASNTAVELTRALRIRRRNLAGLRVIHAYADAKSYLTPSPQPGTRETLSFCLSTNSVFLSLHSCCCCCCCYILGLSALYDACACQERCRTHNAYIMRRRPALPAMWGGNGKAKPRPCYQQWRAWGGWKHVERPRFLERSLVTLCTAVPGTLTLLSLHVCGHAVCQQ